MFRTHVKLIVLIVYLYLNAVHIGQAQLLYNWNTFTTFNSSLQTNLITRLLYQQDTLWIGTDQGLYYMANNQLEKETSFPDHFIKTLSADKAGKLFIGTGCQGVWKRLAPGNYITYNTSTTGSNGLINDCILSLHTSTDSLWVGTEGSGLFLFYNNSWQRFHSGNILGNPNINQVYDIEITNQGDVWIATGQSGLVKKTGNIWQIYDSIFGLPTNRVHCISPINDTIFWIGLGGNSGTNHLVRMDVKNEVILQVVDSTLTGGSIIQNVWNVFTDKQKRHWIGMNNETTGLTVTNDTSFYSYDEFEAGLQSIKIYDFAQDDSNRVWVATFRGLSVNTTQFGLYLQNINENTDIHVFPNPAKEGQFISINTTYDTEIIITNLCGNTIWHTWVTEPVIQWQANVPSGLYLISIKHNNTCITSKLIIY